MMKSLKKSWCSWKYTSFMKLLQEKRKRELIFVTSFLNEPTIAKKNFKWTLCGWKKCQIKCDFRQNQIDCCNDYSVIWPIQWIFKVPILSESRKLRPCQNAHKAKSFKAFINLSFFKINFILIYHNVTGKIINQSESFLFFQKT